jgi:hypothetical protein
MPECVVADAVVVEPVSIAKFPAIRETKREFFNLGTIQRIKGLTSPMMSGSSLHIPCPTEQGILFQKQEALTRAPSTTGWCQGLTAIHDGVRVFGAGTPISAHPVIVRHPETKRKLIYVNSSFTTKINELPAAEGSAILRFLIDHIVKPEWTFRFRWRAHSIAVWDNRCTQHYAIPDYWPNVRSGFRIQIEGSAAPAA